MTWTIRHEGSPQASAGLTLEQVHQGLADGHWEPTDEVMGPGETVWTKLEDHPQFAELAAEIQPPPPRVYGEEGHVDMNALIDVCMVLLIFFILTTSIAAMQSRLDSPDVAPKDDDKAEAVRIIDDKEAEQMVKVRVTMENNSPVIYLEGKKVAPDQVEAELKKIVRGSQKTTLLLDVHPKVPVGVSLPIQRDAAAAGMRDIKRVASPDK